MKPIVNIFWFRRDLRLEDNAGLFHALKNGKPVLPVFIFDHAILDELGDKKDKRVQFIHQSINALQKDLIRLGSTLDIRYGYTLEVYKQLLQEYTIENVFANNDYEPYARQRDSEIASLLKENGVAFHTYRDQVIFEKDEIVKDNGAPYTVFTAYLRRWKETLNDSYLKSYPVKKYFNLFFRQRPKEIPSLQSMNFEDTGVRFLTPAWEKNTIRNYAKQRDFPGIAGTTKLSVHLRFGTISIRELVRKAGTLNESFLHELIWRDFFQMILWHFPQVVQQSFKPDYDKIEWRNNEREFEAWCKGQTGYPIVDAGMRELNETGYMHNRVRMITASFLVKHLLIDWRRGEAYFAQKLNDYDLAANNGGWQWVAGCGCDAAPYFRIFNPSLQAKKFDPECKYIRTWVREWETPDYPAPIVEHEWARKRCIEVYSKALKK